MKLFLAIPKQLQKLFGYICLLSALVLGCTSYRTSHVQTKLQAYEIDEAIHDGATTKSEVVKRFGNRCTIERDDDGREMWVYHFVVSIPTFAKMNEKGVNVGMKSNLSYQNPRYTNQTHFASKYEGFSPEYETKNYTLTLFINEEGTVISHHLIPSDSDKIPAWKSFDKTLLKH